MVNLFPRLRKRANHGFTLLELLVVISIIGILIAMGAVAFSTAQRKSRDSKRRSDMTQMQKAFEQYFADNTGYDTCANMATSQYMPGGLPSDPLPTQSYICNASATSYCACAELEDTASGNADDPGASTTCSFAGGGAYFCVTNLQ